MQNKKVDGSFTRNNMKNPDDPYEAMKEALLRGEMSLSEAQEKIIELDQSTLSREKAVENLKFLLDEEIVAFIDKNATDKEKQGYKALLGFTEFHVAQKLTKENPAESLKFFKEAWENIKNVPWGDSWKAYVEGTILYMENKEIPEDLIERAGKGRNAQILKNFNEGIEERGVSNYTEDYLKK